MSLTAANSARLPPVGGLAPVVLRRESSLGGKAPEFLELTLLPGRGMNFFQARALFPELGEIELLASPSLEEAAEQLSGGPGDFMGVNSFRFGGAVLLPFANRIRGELLPGGRTIETRILDRIVRLPADWQGKRPGAPKCAMHGLILASRMDAIHAGADYVKARLDAGDIGGQWLSRTEVTVAANLLRDSIEFTAAARNIGEEPLPMGIGWHPYFALPSKRRDQARVHLPGRRRGLVDNYDDVFPTGQLEPVGGTEYDFTAPGGAPLRARYFDDSFVDLEKTAQSETVVEIRDPAAHYGVRITALSPHVTAVQMYAPPDKPFIVLEPQFNWADPFSPVWAPGTATGMAILEPGSHVVWAVRCELFVT